MGLAPGGRRRAARSRHPPCPGRAGDPVRRTAGADGGGARAGPSTAAASSPRLATVVRDLAAAVRGHAARPSLGVWLLGWWGLGLAPATALLLGAVLAPTDPVLAGDVQVGGPDVATAGPGRERRAPRGALRADLGSGSQRRPRVPVRLRSDLPAREGRRPPPGWRAGSPGSWSARWSSASWSARSWGGCWPSWRSARRRVSLRLAEQGEPLLALAALATSFGAAELVGGYGFIAVFTCGMAMRNAERSHDYQEAMHGVVERLERLLTLLVLLCLGIAMTRGLLDALDWRGVLAGVALILLLRPISGLASLMPVRPARSRDGQAGTPGDRVLRGQRSRLVVLPRLRRPRHDFEDVRWLWSTVAFTIALSVARARRAGQAGHGLARAGRGAPRPQPGERLERALRPRQLAARVVNRLGSGDVLVVARVNESDCEGSHTRDRAVLCRRLPRPCAGGVRRAHRHRRRARPARASRSAT